MKKLSTLLLVFFIYFSITIAQNPEWINYTNGDYITSLEIENDNLWVGTNGGLVELNTNSREAKFYNHANSGMIKNFVTTVGIDSKGNKWITKAIILGGGPFITEKRIIKLNISDIKGEKLKILLTPPIGFWTFNYFAVDDSRQQPVYITELNPNAVKSQNDKEITGLLSSIDGRYYVEPAKGQQVNLEFEVKVTLSR